VTEPNALPAERNEKQMRLRYAGTCRLCGIRLEAQTLAVYERGSRTVRCLSCTVELSVAAPWGEAPSTVAGASARREHERRKAADEAHLREKWGRLGGIAIALASERQSTAAWAGGALGEEILGALLDSLTGAQFAVLHDRRIPGSTANIDHIVITPAGVWVIDAKRYKNRRPELRIEGGLFRPRIEKLVVGGRDSTKLVHGMLRQLGVVRGILGDDVPVSGALCFIDADWPLVGGAFMTRDIHVLWPKRLAKLLTDREAVGVNVALVREQLACVLR
jgi:Nuclease-related domain